MKKIINEKNMYANIMFGKEYEIEEKRYRQLVDGFCNNFYKQYKRNHFLHFSCHKFIVEQLKKISEINLLPAKKEYIKLRKKNEFFEITICFSLKYGFKTIIWCFPYMINIHKITKYIKEERIEPILFDVALLKDIISPECFDEFDMYMRAQKEGMDLLYSIKKDNPVIILTADNIIDKPYLINGTHRTIQAIKDGKNKIEAYVVDSTVCKTCGMTDEFEEFYELLLNMYFKIYGIGKKRMPARMTYINNKILELRHKI